MSKKAEAPEGFPMSLEEFAATVRLNPLVAAALAVYVTKQDRLLTEWQAILAEYQQRPVVE